MKLLLDTHVFLWLNGSPDKLSDAARQACEDPGNSLHLSLASAWEHGGEGRVWGATMG
jgi:PIN domain nuclease of toxin-antitoxin system